MKGKTLVCLSFVLLFLLAGMVVILAMDPQRFLLGLSPEWDYRLLWLGGLGLNLFLILAMILFLLHVRKAPGESQEKRQLVLEDIEEGYYETDLQGDLTFFNEQLCKIIGRSRHEMAGVNYREYTDPATAQNAYRVCHQVYLTGKPAKRLHWRLQKKDGSGGFMESSVYLMRDRTGNPVGFKGITRDVTTRKRRQETLRVYRRQLRALAAELARTEERERRRIATDLHDGVGQYLLAGKMKLEYLGKKLEGQPARVLWEVVQILEMSIFETRSLIYQLSPPVLHELGLAAALEWQAARCRSRYGLEINFRDDSQPKPMNEEARTLLFRSACELLHNTHKHAKATRADIALSRGDGHLRLEVSDNGVGFDHFSVRCGEARGFGLFSIRERLRLMGGRMEIQSRPRGGTRITLIYPLSG